MKKPRRGRPEWRPTGAERERVRFAAATGIPQMRIAEMIGASLHTVQKHCRAELEHGLDEANTAVARSLFKMATTGPISYVRFSAARFWLSARAGWSETTTLLTTVDNMSEQEIEARLAIEARNVVPIR